MGVYQSWGRYPKVNQRACAPHLWRSEPLRLPDSGQSVLPFGLGRSYGDVCLNDRGCVIPTRWLNRYISFDRTTGLLRCEAGVSLADILDLVIPKGWFLPVTPGTKFVTVGGAIANDVHGKNHHKAGSFGCHVPRFELLRSDNTRLECSADSNPDWYAATIGGMGLTGLITWAEIQLIPIVNRFIDETSIKYRTLDQFFDLTAQYEQSHDYTVAWVDSLASGRNIGRGLFMAGNHSRDTGRVLGGGKKPGPPVPVDFPDFVLNNLTIGAFNKLYYAKQLSKESRHVKDLEPFFYPLDAIQDWNRVYGKRGFLQYQAVVPLDNGKAAVRDMLKTIAGSSVGSAVTVLKVMGERQSPGMMSFPRKGVTLALDFPIKGDTTFRLFHNLDDIVRDAGGRLYAAKDARMTAEDYQRCYPQWRDFEKFIDPRFSSMFWRRVTGEVKHV
ncbi:FAD-binding protein [candidate division GN15 bacterium]|nr:FAD-binding protein [candidate division GN15 bacterium]